MIHASVMSLSLPCLRRQHDKVYVVLRLTYEHVNDHTPTRLTLVNRRHRDEIASGMLSRPADVDWNWDNLKGLYGKIEGAAEAGFKEWEAYEPVDKDEVMQLWYTRRRSLVCLDVQRAQLMGGLQPGVRGRAGRLHTRHLFRARQIRARRRRGLVRTKVVAPVAQLGAPEAVVFAHRSRISVGMRHK